MTTRPTTTRGWRMYGSKYPKEGTPVMIQVKKIGGVCTHVSLLEYNNIQGRILLSDLSSVGSLIKVNQIEPAMVLRVNPKKRRIDLSKKRLSEQDIQVCEERFSKSKLVHSIMRHVAGTLHLDLMDLYYHVGWPLYRKYVHAFEAFKLIVNDPDSVLNPLTRIVREVGPDGKKVKKKVPAISEDVKDALVRIIRRRMTPQPLKIRADIELKCFQFDGVLHIKGAMRKAEALSTKECPVKIKLVAPPAYVLTTQTLDKDQGISVLRKAIVACSQEIEHHQGKLVVKEAPRVVSEREVILLAEQLAKLSEEAEPDANHPGKKRIDMELPVEGPSEVTKKLANEWHCDLCQISVTSELGLEDHLKGKKHKSKQAGRKVGMIGLCSKKIINPLDPSQVAERNVESEKSQQTSNKYETGVESNNIDIVQKKSCGGAVQKMPKNEIMNFKFYCKMCNVGAFSEEIWNSHQKGKKHLKHLHQLG